MLYRENGQFKISYSEDQQILPIVQDRWFMLALLAFAFLVMPAIGTDYLFLSLVIPFLILAIAAIGLETRHSHPDILFFAETLGCTPDLTARTARAGFDYIFNSSKWWDLHSHWLIEQYHMTREVSPSVSFPESHDTTRLCEELQGNMEGMKQRYLLSALFSAGVMMPMGFEFCFRRRLHVVSTTPRDWEESGLDLTTFIRSVNGIKRRYKVFQEEAPTEFLYCANPHVLLVWKASVTTREEALFMLNKDIHNRQHFWSDNLYNLLQASAPLVDVSPEYVLDHVATPFHYELRPGQGIVLITTRDEVPEY